MATFRLGVRILELSHKQPTRTLFSSTKTTPPRSPIRTGFYRTIFVLGTGLFTVYYFDARSAVHRYFLTPALRYTLDAETGHKVAVKVLRSGLGPKDPVTDDEKLRFEVSNMRCAWVMHQLIDIHLAVGSEDNKPYWAGCRLRQRRRSNRWCAH